MTVFVPDVPALVRLRGFGYLSSTILRVILVETDLVEAQFEICNVMSQLAPMSNDFAMKRLELQR